jgi:hypothetical protein
MESDSIRPSGSNTLIDLWIEGKMRAICISRAAIETFVGLKAPETMSEDERCEFVRTHLPQVVAAAKNELRQDPTAETVILDAGQLGGAGERRKGERRKSERRKLSRPVDSLPHGERRRGQRRTGERRQPPKRTDA